MACGNSVCAAQPTAPPVIAPRYSDGAKMPPDPPDPIVRQTARSFPPTSRNSSFGASRPCSAASIVS
ncbi:MAG: hypothetical protein D6776_02975 [Planctomycetota bacterium]|nr:MAG: hypothetical protein D6776_02975 [Planctomycetota bacterium]